MNSRKTAVTKRLFIALGIMLAIATITLSGVISPAALADNEELAVEEAPVLGVNGTEPVRTIMIYLDGASSEENGYACTDMLKEYMAAKFNRSDFRIIVMTGGSLKWHLEASYLRDKDDNPFPPTGEISSEYNQVWEVYGANDGSYLQLLDGDGVSGDGADAKKSTDEPMSDPNTLQKFINYAYAQAPAGKYDLILNDHGMGPEGGYGVDDHDTENPGASISVLQLRQAISGSNVCADGGKFDFIDLDCCMMGNFETALALWDYTDYYLGSADVNPFPTVDFTALFDYLADDPNMDAWGLGRKFVDLFVDYYDEHPEKVSVGRSVGYCVVNVKELKEHGIVDKLLTVARQMRAEATAGSFYDEIRVPKDAYHFVITNLQDFATVVEQLGIGLYESDWQEPGFLNAYTQTALEIQNILHNKDIVYSRHTQKSKETYAFFGRNDDGSIEARAVKTPTSGLNIFSFYNPAKGDASGEVAFYIDAMNELADAMEDPSERELLKTYMQAVLDYELICNAGVAVSTLVENGCAPDEIDYDKVLDYLKSQKSEDHVKKGWEYISKAFEGSDRDVRAWLGRIIDIQRKEVLDCNKVSLKTESKDGTDYYRIDVTDTPKRVIDVPVLTVTASREDEMFKMPTRTLYGTRTLSGAEGESADDYMSATDSSYLIPKFDGQWYAVKDADGKVHLASDASDNSVYAVFYLGDHLMGVGELVFDADGKANSIYIYGNTIPIPLDTFGDVVTVALCNDPSLGKADPIDMFMLEKTNAELVKDSYSNLGINDVEVKLAISDMYEVEHEVKPSLSFDPNGGTWADGGTDVRKFDAGLETEFDIIDAPKRDGYTFVCWKGSEYQPGDKYHADSDHAFTAEWQKIIRLSGSGHVQKLGDVAAKESGAGILIGTTGEAKRLEQFSLSLPKDTNGGIEYRAHLQGKGWGDWVQGGKPCGTTGEARRMEAVQMRLTGALAKTHSVWYRVHSQTWGWLGWACDGQAAGTSGQAKRGEAVEVQVLPKGQVPEGYVEKEASYVGAVSADVHLQKVGWTGASSAVEFGTTGQARRLEAFRLSGPATPVAGGISYEAHVQREGWMPAAADGAQAGTTGQARRLEAVRISLTGEAAKEDNYSVWYRVHSQTYGWLGWAHDGQEAGTTGLAKRAEAIDVQVLPQGQVPRGYDASRAACVNG